MAVIFETSLGCFTVDLYCETRPRCCQNFLKLCQMKYYNFCLFYSIQHNLVAQTGDPTNSGRGGRSIFGQVYGEQASYFEAEFKPRIKHRRAGLLSMVNNGHGMHGSQFFITLSDNLDYLDGVHTVFGEVSEGCADIVSQLNETYCNSLNHKPFKDVRIYHTIVIDDPTPDIKALEFPSRSPSPTLSVYEGERRIYLEDYAANQIDLPPEELQEEEEEKEAIANARILEMIGDLPASDVKPPENVLFVCKLNSVTTSEDLEIIFSRFGTINSCEVIRDQKTGNSLQYAFIEFDKDEECENAYLKMENVLIDDRRIHVDFSQSVAKEWQLYRKGQLTKPNNMQEDLAREKVLTSSQSREDKTKKQRKRSHSPDRRHYKERSRSRDRHNKDKEKHKRRSQERVKNRHNSPEQRRRHKEKRHDGDRSHKYETHKTSSRRSRSRSRDRKHRHSRR